MQRNGRRIGWAVSLALAPCVGVACGGRAESEDGSASGGAQGSHARSTGSAAGAGPCAVGDERCECYPNGTCNGTLTCLSDLCIDYRPATGGTGGDSTGGVRAAGAAGTAGTEGKPDPTGGRAASGGGPSVGLPCDVLADAGLPCVAAHSTARRLVSDYAGPLYQICRGPALAGPDSCAAGEALNIGIVDGHADLDEQNAFCAESPCTVSIVYDQSPMENHLEPAPGGGAKPTPGKPVSAADLPVTVGGHTAYGMLFRPGMGYRKRVGVGTAVDDEPQTIYMVTSQHDLINGCCLDYGNAETSANDDGNGAAEAVYFGMGVIWGTGAGSGPWVMADLESGLYAGWENGQDRSISTNTPLEHDFVTAILVGDTADQNGGSGRFALYGGDATRGEVTTMYDGIRPEKPGYAPMRKQGSVVLSVAGDNSDADGGRFYEGVMANGAAPRETIDKLQASIVAAGYGQ